MVVVCQVDRTFYLKNKHDLWSWNGLVSFESKHDLGTTISGSCNVTTNQGIYTYIYVHLIINDVSKYTKGRKRKDTYLLININFILYKPRRWCIG